MEGEGGRGLSQEERGEEQKGPRWFLGCVSQKCWLHRYGHLVKIQWAACLWSLHFSEWMVYSNFKSLFKLKGKEKRLCSLSLAPWSSVISWILLKLSSRQSPQIPTCPPGEPLLSYSFWKPRAFFSWYTEQKEHRGPWPGRCRDSGGRAQGALTGPAVPEWLAVSPEVNL